jgi:hypothetical protein
VREAFIDASFAPAKRGKTKRGKGIKIVAVADRRGLPVSICIESATPQEVKLATSTLVQMVVPAAPEHLATTRTIQTSLTPSSDITALK